MSAKRRIKHSSFKKDKKFKHFKNIFRSKQGLQMLRRLPQSITQVVAQASILAKVSLHWLPHHYLMELLIHIREVKARMRLKCRFLP